MTFLNKPYVIKDFRCFVEQKKTKSFWDAIPKDPYVKEGFRYKTINRYKKSNGRFVVCPHRPLYQSKIFNPTHGDIHRDYEQMKNEPYSIKLLTLRFMELCCIDEETEVLVQAQRIKTDAKGMLGHPSVEGFHQDGVSYVGVMCIDRKNIMGGVTQISKTKSDEAVIFSGILLPGQIVILDDKNVYHYTSPISVINEEEEGYRDVLLFGC